MTVTIKDATNTNVDIDAESLAVDAVTAQVQGVKLVVRTSATTGVDAPGDGTNGYQVQSNDGALVTVGAKADAVWDGVAANPSEMAILKRMASKAVPATGVGLAALPVYPNAIQLATYKVALNGVASGTLTAATRKDVLSLEHAATAVKNCKVRRIVLSGIATTTTAGTVEFRLFRGVAASTAGTVITPLATNPATAAAEVSAKSLPTITAATGPLISLALGSVSTTANSLISPFVFYDWQENGETQPLLLRAGVLDTLVLAIQSTAAIAVTLYGDVTLTEE